MIFFVDFSQTFWVSNFFRFLFSFSWFFSDFSISIFTDFFSDFQTLSRFLNFLNSLEVYAVTLKLRNDQKGGIPQTWTLSAAQPSYLYVFKAIGEVYSDPPSELMEFWAFLSNILLLKINKSDTSARHVCLPSVIFPFPVKLSHLKPRVDFR